MSTKDSRDNPLITPTAGAVDDTSQNMTRQGGVVAAMTLLSRISGLLRDIVLSYLFGASQLADMFFVALRIPNFFRRLFAEGAFNQAFVPVLIRYKNMGVDDLLGFIAPLSGLFATALLLFVCAGVLLAPQLALLFAPGFADEPGLLQQTGDLVRITFPYLGFISLTAYAGALLNAHNRFALPAFTPVLLNLTLIGAAVVALRGWSQLPATEILAWGVLIAGILQLLFQLPSLAHLKVLPKPNYAHKHPGVRQVGKLLLPAILAASVGQINALVNTILASTLITGSISWLYYADRLLELPIGLVAVALGTVMLPHLSRLAASADDTHFSATLDWGVNLGLMLSLPAAVALYVLAGPLLATLFMSFDNGAMTDHDIRMAGLALQMFAVAMPGFVLVKVLSPAFFAHENTQSPFRYASIAVAVNLVVSLSTFSWFGHVGLAWATAISAWSHVLLLYVGLSRRGLYQATVKLWPMFYKTLLGTGLLAGLLIYINAQFQWLSMPGGLRIAWVAGISAAGLLLYAGLLWLLGVRSEHLRHMSVAQQTRHGSTN
ncbi:MAG: murein biosynthesis integral membrane protein MurJ [bacterium]